MLLFMLLVVAGDVERNPGPLSKHELALIKSYILLPYVH